MSAIALANGTSTRLFKFVKSVNHETWLFRIGIRPIPEFALVYLQSGSFRMKINCLPGSSVQSGAHTLVLRFPTNSTRFSEPLIVCSIFASAHSVYTKFPLAVSFFSTDGTSTTAINSAFPIISSGLRRRYFASPFCPQNSIAATTRTISLVNLFIKTSRYNNISPQPTLRFFAREKAREGQASSKSAAELTSHAGGFSKPNGCRRSEELAPTADRKTGRTISVTHANTAAQTFD